MKRISILILTLYLITSAALSQTYLLRTVAVGTNNDSLYLKINQAGASTDSLYRFIAGSYVFAYTPSIKSFFPFQQLTNVPSNVSNAQTALVSGTNIKTVNGNNILGSGDISISSAVSWGGVTGALSNQTDLNNALGAKQGTITTGTALQYFRGDLSLATFPTTTAAFTNSTNKNFVTDAQVTVIGNTSNTNSGDNATNTQYSGLVTNQNHTGDATGATALTLATVNGNVGSFGSATQVPSYTVNGKGLITAAANTSIQIAESQVTNLVSDLALKSPIASPTFTGTVSGVTATMVGLGNADNTSDLNKPISTATQTALNAKQNTITVLPFANGGISGAAATSATTGTMTVSMTTSVITITPTGACTFNGSGGVAGQKITFAITTSGVSSFVLTWGTNFRKVGTLATGTTSARFFSVTFICIDGTIWQEISRTAAQT